LLTKDNIAFSKVTVASLLLPFLLIIPFPLVTSSQEQQFIIYNDAEERFTIEYPSDWYVNEEPSNREGSVVQFDASSDLDIARIPGVRTEDVTMPSVRIVIIDAESDETSLERLSNKKVNNLAQATMIEESEYTTLSGLPAYTAKTMGGVLENPAKQVWSLHDSKVYHIVYFAHPYDYEIYLPVFQQMINSFNITTSR
jgi:hypothetical protein